MKKLFEIIEKETGLNKSITVSIIILFSIALISSIYNKSIFSDINKFIEIFSNLEIY